MSSDSSDLWPAFEEYLTYLDVERESADSTIQTRRQDLEHACQWFENNHRATNANAVSRRDISRFVDHLVEEGYSYNTIFRSFWPSLSAAFNHLDGLDTDDEIDEIDENPIGGVERQAIKSKAKKALSDAEKKDDDTKDHLSKDEVYELAANTPDPAPRNELLIKLMFWTGVRVSEVVTINIGDDGTLDGPGSDIDPDVPEIEYYSKKLDESHVASYPRQEINPLLRDWVRNGRLRYKRATKTNSLFVGKKGSLSASRIVKIIKRSAERADLQQSTGETVDGRDLQRITPHILRHSFAMHYHNEEGVTLGKIKTALNHTSVKTTEDFYAEATRETIIDTFGK